MKPLASSGSSKSTPPSAARGEGALLNSRRIPAALARPRDWSLLLKLPHVGHETFDVVVRHVFGRLHDLFAVFIFVAFFDGLNGRVVLERVLHLGVGVVFSPVFLAHLRSEERRVGKECRS